jgi:acetyl-CoA carboxylase biotin carboxyl carrier protein
LSALKSNPRNLHNQTGNIIMATAPKTGGRALGKGDLALIRELADILRDTDLSEIEVERGDLKLRVSRQMATQMVHAALPAPAHVETKAAPPGMAPETPAPEAVVDFSVHPGAVRAPMVGTAYLSPEPGATAFVKVGDTVNEGDTLLLIEAMKTFNPILAPSSGKVIEILVDDGAPIEFDEPLLVIG